MNIRGHVYERVHRALLAYHARVRIYPARGEGIRRGREKEIKLAGVCVVAGAMAHAFLFFCVGSQTHGYTCDTRIQIGIRIHM